MFCNIQRENELGEAREERRECNGNVHSRCETAANVSFLPDVIYCSLFFRVAVFLLLSVISLFLPWSLFLFPYMIHGCQKLKWKQLLFPFWDLGRERESRSRDRHSNHGVRNEEEEMKKVDWRKCKKERKYDRKRMRKKRRWKEDEEEKWLGSLSVAIIRLESVGSFTSSRIWNRGSRWGSHSRFSVSSSNLFSFFSESDFIRFSHIRMILPVILSNEFFSQFLLPFNSLSGCLSLLSIPPSSHYSLPLSFRSIEQFRSFLLEFSSFRRCSLLLFCLWKEYFTLSFTSWANRHHHNENSREWMDGWRGRRCVLLE